MSNSFLHCKRLFVISIIITDVLFFCVHAHRVRFEDVGAVVISIIGVTQIVCRGLMNTWQSSSVLTMCKINMYNWLKDSIWSPRVLKNRMSSLCFWVLTLCRCLRGQACKRVWGAYYWCPRGQGSKYKVQVKICTSAASDKLTINRQV